MLPDNEYLGWEPFSFGRHEREELLARRYNQLTRYHYQACPAYKNVLDAFGVNPQQDLPLAELPFLPVRLFKAKRLTSVPDQYLKRTMTSSGTSGQQVSQIHLDKETSRNQTRVLHKIASAFIGTKRLPILILDTAAVVKNRRLYSARGAGILGFSMLGRRPVYALDEQMNLDSEAIRQFVAAHGQEPFLLFGFTAIIWQHFLAAYGAQFADQGLRNGILIHGGGWKKLAAAAVSPQEYDARVNQETGIARVINYYGMVEQTGSIFMQCERGYFHCSIYSDIFVRDAEFRLRPYGQEGVIEVRSLLPVSYPGHIILTEDVGTIWGEDDCACGRLGKYFTVAGRVPNAEIRGCSDTYHA